MVWPEGAGDWTTSVSIINLFLDMKSGIMSGLIFFSHMNNTGDCSGQIRDISGPFRWGMTPGQSETFSCEKSKFFSQPSTPASAPQKYLRFGLFSPIWHLLHEWHLYFIPRYLYSSLLFMHVEHVRNVINTSTCELYVHLPAVLSQGLTQTCSRHFTL